jgi:hypothetical protein
LSHPRRYDRLALLIGAALCCVLLAACTNGNKSPEATATTSKAAPGATTSVPGGTQVPYDKNKNAHFDVNTDGPCRHEADGTWVLKGTVVNPNAAPTGFSVVVDFVQVPGDTVLDTQIVTVPPVTPKQTVHWQASWKYAGSQVSCVVRQSQTT